MSLTFLNGLFILVDIMDEALSFTRNHFESLAKSASPHLSGHIPKHLLIFLAMRLTRLVTK